MSVTNPRKALRISELVNNFKIDLYKWVPELINDEILKTTKHVSTIPILIGERERKFLSNLRVYVDLNNLERYIRKTKLKAVLILLIYLIIPYILSWICFIYGRVSSPLWKLSFLVNLIIIVLTLFVWVITSAHYIIWFFYKKPS